MLWFHRDQTFFQMKPVKKYLKVYTPCPQKNIKEKLNRQYIVHMYAIPESHILFQLNDNKPKLTCSIKERQAQHDLSLLLELRGFPCKKAQFAINTTFPFKEWQWCQRCKRTMQAEDKFKYTFPKNNNFFNVCAVPHWEPYKHFFKLFCF